MAQHHSQEGLGALAGNEEPHQQRQHLELCRGARRPLEVACCLILRRAGCHIWLGLAPKCQSKLSRWASTSGQLQGRPQRLATKQAVRANSTRARGQRRSRSTGLALGANIYTIACRRRRCRGCCRPRPQITLHMCNGSESFLLDFGRRWLAGKRTLKSVLSARRLHSERIMRLHRNDEAR